MLRIPGTTPRDDACSIVALDLKMLSWFDLNHRHIHRDTWHKGKSLKHGGRCTAATAANAAAAVY